MCNEQRFSESGAPIAPTRCADYISLASDRDRLAGVVAGMEEQNARNIDALRRAEAENARLYAIITSAIAEYDDCCARKECTAERLINETMRGALNDPTNG